MRHVAPMGKRKLCIGLWWENLEEREQWEDSDVDKNIMLIWILCKKVVRLWIGSSWLKIGTGGWHL